MPDYSASLHWIDSQQSHLLERTMAWSAINSGSMNIKGLQEMLEALQEAFSPLGGEMEKISLTPRDLVTDKGAMLATPLGKALRIRKHPQAPLQVFLGGHMDTVFAADHPFQIPVMQDAERLRGPGVADLKGGLSVMLTALTALEQSEWAGKIGWEVLINPDEEIGSPGSDALLKEAAARNDLGLIYEPALADGTLVSARKGSGNFTAVIHGRAAHVGRAFQDGRNAVIAAAELAQDLSRLTGGCPGVLCNVGKIEGGGPVNMVPDLAIVRFNIRVDDAEEQAWTEKKLHGMQERFNAMDGLSLEFHGRFGRPAKKWDAANEHLFLLIRACGEALSLSIQAAPTGGCCDGNNLAAYGLPNIDTLGVRGGHLHTDQEFMIIESLSERAKLSALLLLKLASGELSWPHGRSVRV